MSFPLVNVFPRLFTGAMSEPPNWGTLGFWALIAVFCLVVWVFLVLAARFLL